MKGIITTICFILAIIVFLIALYRRFRLKKKDKISVAFRVVLFIAVLGFLAYIIVAASFFKTNDYNDHWAVKITRYPYYYNSQHIIADVYVYRDNRYVLYPNAFEKLFGEINGKLESEYDYYDIYKYVDRYQATIVIEKDELLQENQNAEDFDPSDLSKMRYDVTLDKGVIKKILPQDIADSGNQNIIDFFNEVYDLMFHSEFK